MNLGVVYFLSTDDRKNVVKYDYRGKFHRQISRSKIINRQKDFELNSLSHSQISNSRFFWGFHPDVHKQSIVTALKLVNSALKYDENLVRYLCTY